MSQINDINLSELRQRLESQNGQAYWRSLEELADTEEFQHFMSKEFPNHVAPLEHTVDRRDFIKLLGASLALAGLTSCVRPVRPSEKIVPYVRAPEEIIPGKPLHFATAMTQGGYALGLIAESHQGRPTKLEGNPDHPASLGATDATTQATVLSLYDPDRSQAILQSGQSRNWADAGAALSDALAALPAGEGFYLLTETITSPTLASQLQALQSAYPAMRWHQYEPLHADAALAGAQMAFGEAVQTHFDFSKADVVLSLGADFLGQGPAKLRYSKDFSRRRRVYKQDDSMNRLYLLETTPGITSGLADHKLPLRPVEISAFAVALAQELGLAVSGSAPSQANAFLRTVVEDLQRHAGRSIVMAGDDQPAEVHALVHAINAQLGNVGEAVLYSDPVEVNPVSHMQSIAELTTAMQAGDVKLLVMLGGNPVYTAPADLNFAGALESVPNSVHLSLYQDETSSLSSWHLPMTHFLETWSDARAFDGTITIMQPLISPFYGGKSEHEILAVLLGNPEATSYDIVRSFWRDQVDGDFEAFWRQSVYAGVVAGSQSSPKSVALAAQLPEPSLTASDLDVVFLPDPSIQDGRYANNGWLQEVPKPITKLTWDNAAFVSPRDAERLGLNKGDLVTLTVAERSVTAPVWIMPGQAVGAVSVFLGFGRSNAGRVGNAIGFDAYQLRSSANPAFSALQIAKVPGRHKLISTQGHHIYEGTTEKRHIVRHGTLEQFRIDYNPIAHPVPHHESDIFGNQFEYKTYAWGMVIDMNVCSGCNACVTACQAENNIPIVGKRQVEVGREMHWIRVDTYYAGGLDNPSFYTQPINCMHCEQAPCEPVCPVGATVHDDEGLNVMVYNRCVGTRYCSNNCPYKVRRYNFLQYAELTTTMTELSLAQNPNVTVRSRGVMEKCSYCIQRIKEAYITSENEQRKIQDGEVVTACQSACPMEAITFGDLNDEGSQVSQVRSSKLNYSLLEELNTKPRTTYLAKLTNPNPLLAAQEGGVNS